MASALEPSDPFGLLSPGMSRSPYAKHAISMVAGKGPHGRSRWTKDAATEATADELARDGIKL